MEHHGGGEEELGNSSGGNEEEEPVTLGVASVESDEAVMSIQWLWLWLLVVVGCWWLLWLLTPNPLSPKKTRTPPNTPHACCRSRWKNPSGPKPLRADKLRGGGHLDRVDGHTGNWTRTGARGTRDVQGAMRVAAEDGTQLNGTPAKGPLWERRSACSRGCRRAATPLLCGIVLQREVPHLIAIPCGLSQASGRPSNLPRLETPGDVPPTLDSRTHS